MKTIASLVMSLATGCMTHAENQPTLYYAENTTMTLNLKQYSYETGLADQIWANDTEEYHTVLPGHTCLLPPQQPQDEDFKADGLLAWIWSDLSNVRVTVIDLSDDSVFTGYAAQPFLASPSTKMHITPLPKGLNGYAYGFTGLGGVNVGIVRDLGSSNTLQGTNNGNLMALHADRGLLPLLLAGIGSTTAGNPQLISMRETVDWTSGGSYGGTLANQWTKEYVASDWADWADRPDTCFDIQNLPLEKTVGFGATVILLGDYTDSGIPGPGVTNPRLAIINSQFGPGLGVQYGAVVRSHAEGSGRANGFCIDQNGYIYVVGTSGLNASNNHLIEKYDPRDLETPLAYVDWQSNGLGSGPTGSPHSAASEANIYAPSWDGNNLVVQDHDAERTRLHVFNSELEWQQTRTVSNTSAVTTLRISANKKCVPWWGQAH